MPVVKLRDMRARDMVKHSRYQVPKFAGIIAELEGKEIAAAAIVIGHGARPIITLELEPEARRFPVLLHRMALKLVQTGVNQLGTLYAHASPTEPTADKWLRRLGFMPTEEWVNGERVYKWHQ